VGDFRKDAGLAGASAKGDFRPKDINIWCLGNHVLLHTLAACSGKKFEPEALLREIRGDRSLGETGQLAQRPAARFARPFSGKVDWQCLAL
jgi:hypothetical protein